MRCLVRNKVVFFYAPYAGKAPLTDEYGNRTGEYEVRYSDPQKAFANISAAQGETETRQFGDSEVYDKVIVLDDPGTAIDEHAVLWVDSVPALDANGALKRTDSGEAVTPHDYIVVRKAVSRNSVSFAIRKVDVS